MSQVWVLLRTDYEDAECLGVYSTQAQGQHAQQVLWQRYQALTHDQQALVGPYAMLHAGPVTWASFTEWHPLVAYILDGVPIEYAAPASVVGVQDA